MDEPGFPSTDHEPRGSLRSSEWWDFVASIDTAVVLVFLIDDAESHSSTYFKALVPRIREAWGEKLVDADDDLATDPYFLELADELDESAPSEEFGYRVRSLAVVAIHSALEAYVQAVVKSRRPLPEQMRDGLRASSADRDAESLLRAIGELDATRHIVVHNQGVVDRRYLERVPSSEHRVGEKRPLPREQLLGYAQTALWGASRLRRVVAEAHPHRLSE